MPDGITIVAHVGDYRSAPVAVEEGRYRGLVVGPPNSTYAGMTITFHLGGVRADQTDIFTSSGFPTLKAEFQLTFQMLP